MHHIIKQGSLFAREINFIDLNSFTLSANHIHNTAASNFKNVSSCLLSNKQKMG